MAMLDEASFIGFFPHRKAWAGRSPRFDYFGVWTRVRTDPFKQVKDQSVYGVRHGSLLSGQSGYWWLFPPVAHLLD
jgi:hypothetical protein